MCRKDIHHPLSRVLVRVTYYCCLWMLSTCFCVVSSEAKSSQVAAKQKELLGLCDFWEGSVFLGDSCYKVFEEIKTWETSKIACVKSVPGGLLSEPPDVTTVKFLHNLMMASKIGGLANGSTDTNPYGAWIGASKKNVANAEYVWASNSQAMWTMPTSLFSPIVSAGDLNPASECLTLSMVSSDVRAVLCDVKKRYICQVGVNTLCPGNRRYHDGYCYFFEKQDKKILQGNYDEAKSACGEESSFPVEIYTPELVDFLQDFMLEFLWQTVNYDQTSFVEMELAGYGIRKVPGVDLCFLVKGIEDGYLTLYPADGANRIDASGRTCFQEISVHFLRTEEKSRVTLEVSDTCHEPNGFGTGILKQRMLLHEWFHYCIGQDTNNGKVLLHYDDIKGVRQAIALQDADFTVDMPFARFQANQPIYQLKFPIYSTFVYLGAIGSLDQWETGASIDYSLLDIPELSVSPGQDRLLFQNHPMTFQPTDRSVVAPILCRHTLSKGWGRQFYYGAVPFDLSLTSQVYLSYHATSTVLFNHYPNILETTLTYTYVTSTSPTSKNLPINIYDFVGPVGVPAGTIFTFLIRSSEAITVELFTRTSKTIFSTLVFPEKTTGSKYVICAPHTNKGQIIIVNHDMPNSLVIIPPAIREVYFIIDDIHYRSLQIEKEEFPSHGTMTIGFKGDVTGTTISGTETISVFVATTQGEDVSYDQMIPSTFMGDEYVTLIIPYEQVLVPMTTYKMAAFLDDTIVKSHNKPDVTLAVHGDTADVEVTSKSPHIMSSKRHFYLSVIFSDEKMSCATTVLPPRYWDAVYSLTLTSDHFVMPVDPEGGGNGPTSFGGNVTLVLIVETEEETPMFYFNGLGVQTTCARITDTLYYSCYYKELPPGFYVIQHGIIGEQPFAAYVIGGQKGLSCYIRLAGIKYISTPNNKYPVPPFVAPEECPVLPPDPTLPTPTHPYANVTLTAEVEEEIRERVREELEVDAHSTSLYVRKKISVPDSRPSSTSMGITGLVIIAMVTALLILPDTITVGAWVVKKLKGQVGGGSEDEQ